MKDQLQKFGFLLTLLPFSLYASDLPASRQGQEASGIVNPSSRFQVDNGWNLFLNMEFLWWVAKEDGLYFAQSGVRNPPTSAVPPNGAVDFKGHLQKVKPIWHPAFRIGLGGNMSYDEWDLFLNWTWFSADARKSSKGSLLPLWGHPDAAGASQASYARGKWELLYNTIDLEMGRSFWVGRHFSLRPFIGARGAWIDQHFKIKYDYVTLPTTSGKLHIKSDFDGGGVRAGVDARFALFNGWSFYGLASAAMLYGFFDCDFNERWQEAKISKTRDGFHQATSTLQMALGVRWDTYVHKDRYHFGIYAGWEQNIWYGLNKMNHFFGNLQEGNLQQINTDLCLQGGTFGIRFDF
jgi:hypothetical protein